VQAIRLSPNRILNQPVRLNRSMAGLLPTFGRIQGLSRHPQWGQVSLLGATKNQGGASSGLYCAILTAVGLILEQEAKSMARPAITAGVYELPPQDPG